MANNQAAGSELNRMLAEQKRLMTQQAGRGAAAVPEPGRRRGAVAGIGAEIGGENRTDRCKVRGQGGGQRGAVRGIL